MKRKPRLLPHTFALATFDKWRFSRTWSEPFLPSMRTCSHASHLVFLFTTCFYLCIPYHCLASELMWTSPPSNCYRLIRVWPAHTVSLTTVLYVICAHIFSQVNVCTPQGKKNWTIFFMHHKIIVSYLWPSFCSKTLIDATFMSVMQSVGKTSYNSAQCYCDLMYVCVKIN